MPACVYEPVESGCERYGGQFAINRPIDRALLTHCQPCKVAVESARRHASCRGSRRCPPHGTRRVHRVCIRIDTEPNSRKSYRAVTRDDLWFGRRAVDGAANSHQRGELARSQRVRGGEEWFGGHGGWM